jgi:hypothetical protein
LWNWWVAGSLRFDTTIALIATVFGLGIVFFKLLSLPERVGHKKHSHGKTIA